MIPPIYINIDMHEPSDLLGSSSCFRRNEANIVSHFTSGEEMDAEEGDNPLGPGGLDPMEAGWNCLQGL